MTGKHTVLETLSAEHRARLLALAHDVAFPRGARIFEEGGEADRFWVLRSGLVALDFQLPGVRTPVFETVGQGELLGWSWLFEPGRWTFGAQAVERVEAYEFPAADVRELCRQDRDFAAAVFERVAATIAHRLTTARRRLLGVYGSLAASLATTAGPGARKERPAGAPAPYRVEHAMTRDVVTVDRSAPFKEIVHTLHRWEVSAVPVVEGDGRVAGVISEADLLRKEEFHDRDMSLMEQFREPGVLPKVSAVTAEELMSSPAVTVHRRDTLGQAARVMAKHRVKRLPVVDSQERLQGIISRGDLLKVFLRSDEAIADSVRNEIADLPFLAGRQQVDVQVDEGVVTLRGTVEDTAHIPLVVRLARSVEGVVDVEPRLTAA